MDKTTTPMELKETNDEMAAFLGEDTKNLPAEVELVDVEVLESNKMDAVRPDGLSDEENEIILKFKNDFVKQITDDPTDMTLSSKVYKIGQTSAALSIPNVKLYDTLISDIMKDNQDGINTEGSKEQNMLMLKKELDLINPAVLAKTPIKQKFLLFLNKTSLPGAEKVMEMIYERQETVKSTIDGIKVALLQNADDLDNQLADLMIVYKGLLKSHLSLKGEIYTGQLIYNDVVDIADLIVDPIAKQNIEAVLADLTTQINSLIVEENMNAQFFAGSQMTAKLVREQQNQIRILVRQMEKAVLANLGLRVVAKGLENSVNQSKALGSAIANTIADTAAANEKTSIKLQKARTEGYIDIAKLQEGVDSLTRTFEREAQANKLIIKQGLSVAKTIKTATNSLEARIDQSAEIAKETVPEITENKEA